MATYLVSFSNFKGTLSNTEACAIACEALREEGHTATALPLGDGGKGTFAFLDGDPSIQKRSYQITGAFGDPRTAQTWWRKTPAGIWQIFLESTDAIGYPPTQPEKRDPLGATSRGLGEWLLHIAKDLGTERCELFIGLGDSAISDAGQGMMESLGEKRFSQWRITVLCDVDNPLCGERGSARVFSPQKGAAPVQVAIIEKRNAEWAKAIKQNFGIDVSEMPRAGSAGGLAAALHVFLKGELVSGAEFVLKASGFEEILKHHDVLIVGEGKSDFQTLSGKSPWAAIQVAEKLGKKSILISGVLGEGAEKIAAPGLIAKIACGREPDARGALARAVREMVLP
ncbi:MAG: glycerate kinase [Proteobacteria bacterium]|nr:glycerate kinase [Pseudomonadota bacterium]